MSYLVRGAMAAKHTLHVALTEPLVRPVRAQVTTCRYATASEVLRDASRLLIEREDGDPKQDATPIEKEVTRHG